ncbi:MAG: pantetheine-phosphate adenylyltransferase [Thermoflavifilum sp.]|nr:pantetheine-phosphate adenylyltransferase [Thermoflavifilum sp.]
MEKACLFPGTFDPITLGHVDIIRRALQLFDRVVVGIGSNVLKQPMFSLEQRLNWIREVFADESRVEVAAYEGLTVEYCRQRQLRFILRGIRYVSDFEYEKSIADMNRALAPEIETIFLTSSPAYSTTASTLIRDVLRNGGDASPFLPEAVNRSLAKR